MIRHDGAAEKKAEGKAGPHLLGTILELIRGGEENLNQSAFCVCALTHKVPRAGHSSRFVTGPAQ
jgi:hypothetical protein